VPRTDRDFAVRSTTQMTLPLSVHESVSLDLEGTYRRATEAAYLS
jgi:hypothetical protein